MGRPKGRVRRKTYKSYVHFMRQGGSRPLCGCPLAGVLTTDKVNLVTCPWCKDEMKR